MQLVITCEKNFLAQAESLLYKELWEPLGLPATVRDEFKAGPAEKTLVALKGERVVGVFILVEHGDGTTEIRHAAVDGSFHGMAIGRRLFKKVLDLYNTDPCVGEITVYARNNSVDFWQKQGFTACSDWLDHEMFAPHGIRFRKMSCRLIPNSNNRLLIRTGEKDIDNSTLS